MLVVVVVVVVVEVVGRLRGDGVAERSKSQGGCACPSVVVVNCC